MGKAEHTRAVLLRAAANVIGRHGFTGATVDKIAKEAGVSKGNLYYHFKTKADIATSVLTGGMQRLSANLRTAAEESESGPDALCRMLSMFAQSVFSDPALARFMLTELWRNDRIWSDVMHKQEDECVLIIQQQIERGRAEGLIRQEVDARFAAVAMVGTVLTSTQYYLMESRTESLDERCQQFEQYVTDYLAHALFV